MKPTTLQMSLVARSLVLLELQRGGPLSGEDLAARVEERCSLMRRKQPDFDFVQWAQTPIGDLLDTLGESGYLEHAGPSRRNDREWCVAHITLTQRGVKFLQAAEREAGSSWKLLSC